MTENACQVAEVCGSFNDSFLPTGWSKNVNVLGICTWKTSLSYLYKQVRRKSTFSIDSLCRACTALTRLAVGGLVAVLSSGTGRISMRLEWGPRSPRHPASGHRGLIRVQSPQCPKFTSQSRRNHKSVLSYSHLQNGIGLYRYPSHRGTLVKSFGVCPN